MSQQMSQMTPRLESLLAIYPIRKRLVEYLDTRDLLKLLRTSWGLRLTVRANEWNVNNRLSRFFRNPLAFRSSLRRSDALISGSFALQFFERVTWPESDLDIMVRDGDALEEMHRYLTKSEGYSMVCEAMRESKIAIGIEATGYSDIDVVKVGG